MKLLIVVAMTVALAGVSANAAQPGKQKKHKEVQHAVETDRDSGANVAVHVVFGRSEIQVVRSHYAPRYANLPRGLQKKVARGGALPPGWQKKMEPFPPVLERRLSALPPGYSRGVIDAHAVIYNSRGIIVDVAVLF